VIPARLADRAEGRANGPEAKPPGRRNMVACLRFGLGGGLHENRTFRSPAFLHPYAVFVRGPRQRFSTAKTCSLPANEPSTALRALDALPFVERDILRGGPTPGSRRTLVGGVAVRVRGWLLKGW